MSMNLANPATPYRPAYPKGRQARGNFFRRRRTFLIDHQDPQIVICPYCERKGHIEKFCHWKRLDEFLMGVPCYAEKRQQQRPRRNRGRGNRARQRAAQARRRRENRANLQQPRPEGGSERRTRNRHRQRFRRRYYLANTHLSSLPASTNWMGEQHRAPHAAH
ncbi:uncharacterized protein LDX57_008365 [Aspergillus melleus]|uniref:uncharacterized protein n=1 Tax=Aspergillus melleus TaxID=138277 RepID=UPI001E8E6982|nr:uncharacterized protein LDX57_008365 [Aspergillus melleus]KAH8430703.1 hypothetical protein LDX57_008365 [Aspergillus melleus]